MFTNLGGQPGTLDATADEPLAQQVDVQAMGQRYGRYRRAGLLALAQDLRLELGAMHAPLGSGLHRCPPVRIGGHHRQGRFSAVQDETAGRSQTGDQSTHTAGHVGLIA